MNLKIALATAVLFTGGAYVSNAQQQTTPATAKAAAIAKTFNSKVSEYEKATAAQQGPILEELKHQMDEGVAAAKQKIILASNNTENQQASERYQKRVSAYNDVNSLSKSAAGKAGIIAALKQYAATL
ncbi:hypothetical protein [Taibaiella koreensis]|uniref:hypothetical protein n=1 Tax=Taibaiella koreensis TaxID=1268548 RepID=UPI0013C2A444|nr:hypothetical protein [Taibaiella koreensis]